MAAPSSVPMKNNNFKLVDQNKIIKIKKNDGKEIPKGADLGKFISVKTEDRVINKIYQKVTKMRKRSGWFCLILEPAES